MVDEGEKFTSQGLDHRLPAILYVWTMTLSSDLMGPHSSNTQLIGDKEDRTVFEFEISLFSGWSSISVEQGLY